MRGLALMLLAEVAGPTLPAPGDAGRCPGAAGGGEIAVCGRPTAPDRYRLWNSGTAEPEGGLPPAELRLFGDTRIGVTTEQASLGGVPSNRVMVRLRIPLGRGRR